MRRIRPPKSVLEQYGQEWAVNHNYRQYANGSFRAKHGTIFRDASEIGYYLVKAGMIRKVGKEYQMRGA